MSESKVNSDTKEIDRDDITIEQNKDITIGTIQQVQTNDNDLELNKNISIIDNVDINELNHHDISLSNKMFLINNAIDEIGFTGYQLKMFFLNGMGYAVDSLLTMIQSSVLMQVQYQFGVYFPASSVALYAGLLVGALLWGISADIIGRKFAFNSSLFVSAIFGIIAGAMPTHGSYCLMVALSAAGSGGNLVLDTTVFLEYLPHRYQWLMTFFACWWGVGQIVAVLVAWPFMVNFSCTSYDDCPASSNNGWRYTWYTESALVMVIAIARVTIIRLKETPKFLLVHGRDEECVNNLQSIAKKYGRTCSLTLEQLNECGDIKGMDSVNKRDLMSLLKNIKIQVSLLFKGKNVALSTSLIFLSWALIGIAYPLYSDYLPQYLSSRGADTGDGSLNTTFKNYAITNFVTIFGPMIATGFIFVPYRKGKVLGRRGSMTIGAFITMIFLFAYTAVKTQPQNVGFTSAVYVALYWYYGILYAFTPEVLPSAARGTGNGIAVSMMRLMGCITPVIAYFSGTFTAAPIYVCAAVVGSMGIISLFFPFEPTGKRVV